MSGSPSIGASLPTSGLPVVNQALEPAWVRHGSTSVQKAYETALSFEEMLVEQLSHSLTATSGLEGEAGGDGESSPEAGSSSAGASGGPLASMLPEALTSGVMNAGGLGLAAQMTRQLESGSGIANAGAGSTGGTQPAPATQPPPAGGSSEASATGAVAANGASATEGSPA